MATVSYITPITNRTNLDVEYARDHQADLTVKNIGAWNYTDLNRICNNLKYAAEYMYEQGFFDQPYSIQVKLDWKETDIITYETLNSMVVDNMNNLKTYSRPDLSWYPIASIVNMDYNLANWLEKNINSLATQLPIPPDKYELLVEKGSGSGEYEANTVVEIKADPPDEGMMFDYWSGDHLENIGSATAAITTYTMPHQNIRLIANYTSLIPHKLKIVTYTSTIERDLSMGDIFPIEADPAPQGKVFHHWEVNPSQYEDNLYEPAATTTFTMPNEAVTLTAIYITKGEKQLVVQNGKGSGWYEYDTYAAISSNKPSNGTFTSWSGDTQYLTGPVTQEYNSVKIPDKSVITIRANWTTPAVPPVTNVSLTVVNGVISSTGETTGSFTEGNRIAITANSVPEGYVFAGWSRSGGGSVSNSGAMNATAVIGTTAMTVTANYRKLEYYELTVNTHSGTTTTTKERYDYFSVNANPAPEGYTFDKWTGNTGSYNGSTFHTDWASTGTYMGTSNRTITATYRQINLHELTVKQLSGDITYEQEEFTTVSITAEDAPEGMVFTGWSKSGSGNISSNTSQTITYTFGNGDCTLTPNYVNVWTISVSGGTINGSSSAVLRQGSAYDLRCRSLAVYERFDGWTLTGPGSINNIAATSTRFTVGSGNATIAANITQYPDKTLTVYFKDPDTEEVSLVSQQTYTYGTKISLEAPIAPDKTTFSSWLGDVDAISPSALASSITINSLTKDVVLTATYYYPKAPEYYTLTVIKGTPEEAKYATGSQIPIRANDPAQGWEFYSWMGDISYLVNPDLTLPENSVIMPTQSIKLEAKYNEVGELPTWRVTVTNGTASASYINSEGEVIEVGPSIYIDVPEGTEVTLTADPDVVGYTFRDWSGNFDAAGVTDIVKTNNPTVFTMVKADINAIMNRRPIEKATVYTTNATGAGEFYPGTYPITGNLIDTDDKHYTFVEWTCIDEEGNNRIDVIGNPTEVETTITVKEGESFWIEAHYVTHYKLTVINGQDTGDGYYYEGETINTITANESPEQDRMMFDHWDDPMNVVANKYDKTPIITMRDTVATITAVYVSMDGKGNSVAITGDDLHSGVITRSNSYLVNGMFVVGTLVLDKDGCIGVITNTDVDENDDTEDYAVEKLFYGGNF